MENSRSFRNYLRDFGRRLRLAGGASAFFLTVLFIADWGGDPERDGQARAVALLAGVLGFSYLRRPLTAPIAAFLSYLAIRWVLNDYPMHGAEHLAAAAASLLVADWLSKQAAFPAWISWLGAAEAVFGLAQWLGWNPYEYELPWYLNKPTGTFGQETIYGAFVAMALAPALFTRRYVLAVPIALACYATHSTMTAAAAGAVVALWAFSRWGWKPISAGAAALAAVYTVMSPDNPWLSSTRRTVFWAMGWAFFEHRPIFGWGPGSWLPMAPTLDGLQIDHLHNEYLEALVEYGCVGATLWGASILQYLRGFRLTWHHALCAAFLVNAIGNFPLHIASTGTIFLAGWLLCVRERCSVVSLPGTQGGADEKTVAV